MPLQLQLIIDLGLVVASACLYSLWNTKSVHLKKETLKYLSKEHRLAFENLAKDFSGKTRLQVAWVVVTGTTMYMLYETFRMI